MTDKERIKALERKLKELAAKFETHIHKTWYSGFAPGQVQDWSSRPEVRK